MCKARKNRPSGQRVYPSWSRRIRFAPETYTFPA